MCLWESIKPITDVQISNDEKASWLQLPINKSVHFNILKYTDFEWTVHSSDYSYATLFPQRDHTLNKVSGNYLLFDGRSPRTYYDRAIIVSDHYEITPQNRSLCLKFYYYYKSSNYFKFYLDIYQSESFGNVTKIRQIIDDSSNDDWTLYNITAHSLNTTSTNMWFYLVHLISI